MDDDGESVKLTFGTLPTGVSAGTTNESTVSITDDDVPSVTVSFEQASYTVDEGSSVTVKVKLDADPERTVTIPVTTINQGGATSADYSGVPNSVTFNSADREKTFSFNAASDSVDDDGESVKLTFGTLPTGVSAGTTNESTVSITDDDVPSVVVSFEQGDYTVAEGSTVNITVTLSADPERTIRIPLTVTNQGGASDDDHSLVPDAVTFNSGQDSRVFTFRADQDTHDDDEESVKIGFGTLPAGVTTGTTDTATVSITDDDVPSVAVSFEQGTYAVAEGGSATVKVKLSADPERTVTIPLTTTNQDGATSSDYSGVPGSVVFNSGEREKTFNFTAASDTDNDDGESVKLGFGTLPARVTSTSPSEAVVSITDDDVPPVTVSFGSETHSVLEGESATVTVTLSAAPERTVTIPITRTNQNEASDSDYSGVPSNVVFASSETEKTFDFEATDDGVEDDDESVKLTFGSLPAGVTEGATNETVLSILDIDGGREGLNKGIPEGHSVIVNFERASYTVAEGSSVTVKVTLDQDPRGTVIIPLTKTDQGGVSSADYSGVPASVEFVSGGDIEKAFSFFATQDTTDDDGESVSLTFGTLPTGVSAGTTDESTVSITDDDDSELTQESMEVSYEVSAYALFEGLTVEIEVVLSDEPESSVTIPLTATHQSGTTLGDYAGVPNSVTFNSGQAEKSFAFTAVQDEDDEDAEVVTLGFGNLPDGVSAGAQAQATVTIFDSLRVSFDASRYEAYEGGAAAQVTVLLDSAVVMETVIPLTAVGMNGATEEDWTGVPEQLVLFPGERSKTFSVMAYDDALEDGGETVELGFGILPTGVVAGSPSTATVELMNTEEPSHDLAQCPTPAAQRTFILQAMGEITTPGESAFWTVELDPVRSYLVDAIGADDGRDLLGDDSYSGDLTLEDPNIVALWDEEGRTASLVATESYDSGYGRNDVHSFSRAASGQFRIEIASGNGGTGTYQIKVRINNVCRMVNGKPLYAYDGGPEGYSKRDIPADTSTTYRAPVADVPVSTGHFLGDNWDTEPDEDWWSAGLTGGREYKVELWTPTGEPEKHQATQLKILGIYDSNGTLINGTASPGSGRRVSITFQPSSSGRYYISVGSDGADRTGLYRISVLSS